MNNQVRKNSSDSTRRNGPKNNPRSRSKNRRNSHSRNSRPAKPMVSLRTDMPKLPELKDNIRIIPLGGVEEVGRNMTAIEFKDDIIVIDAGFQFQENDTPGIDYILPNTSYLEANKEKIRALFVTHGHLDHIGGIPYLMDRIGNPPIYSRSLTTIMIKKRQEEFPHLPALNIHTVEKDESVLAGNLKVHFFAVTHSIPDSMGIIIDTPYGAIVNPGDIKLDHEDGVPTEKEQEAFKKFDSLKTVFLMADSTNVENPGFSTPERMVHEELERVIRTTNGRLIIGTFASQVERMVKILEISEKLGKKVVVEGRSMKNNIEIIRQAGILTIKKETIVSAENMDDYPPDRIVALVTGAQGDEFAALMRMSNKTHKYFKVSPRDTILLSSSIIPGNERAVQKLKDNLSRQGAKIIHYRSSDGKFVHSTGHGNREELLWVHKKIKPKFFMPIHGSHYMLRVHEELAVSNGMARDNIVVPDNGNVIEIRNEGKSIIKLKDKVPNGGLMVDGLSIGNMQEIVLRDRKMLSEEGMFVIIASIDLKTGKLKKSPDIISRGFVYLRESQDLLQQTRLIIKKTVEKTTQGMNPINFDYVKSNITDEVSKFLLLKTAKRPIVVPVVLGTS